MGSLFFIFKNLSKFRGDANHVQENEILSYSYNKCMYSDGLVVGSHKSPAALALEDLRQKGVCMLFITLHTRSLCCGYRLNARD